MARVTHTIASLELSQAAYDEIEAKLLAAGYEHLFAAGPGSAIDLQGIVVTREQDTPQQIVEELLTQEPHNWRRGLRHAAIAWLAEQDRKVGDQATYCFMCDQMVDVRCDRENCLRAANDRVRADLGLVP
jgi:hypothetical protein